MNIAVGDRVRFRILEGSIQGRGRVADVRGDDRYIRVIVESDDGDRWWVFPLLGDEVEPALRPLTPVEYHDLEMAVERFACSACEITGVANCREHRPMTINDLGGFR